MEGLHQDWGLDLCLRYHVRLRFFIRVQIYFELQLFETVSRGRLMHLCPTRLLGGGGASSDLMHALSGHINDLILKVLGLHGKKVRS